jgi:methylmalonyl-CoA mutase N-terminal domain/subunit
VDSFAGRLSFFFASHNNLFEEVAKFRAARRLWAHIMRERFRARDPRSWMMRFHTQTAGVTLTAQQPQNNIVRTTIQALAAVLGGTQSLHVNSWDEAYALPSEGSAQLSLRTQQILAYESGVADVVDPLGGSYYVEHLTNQLETETNKYLERIGKMGGALAALEQGFQMREIHQSAYDHLRKVESKERIVVGVNQFGSETPPIEGLLRVDPEVAKQQTERLRRVRKERDATLAKRCLAQLEEVARGSENTLPVTLECVEAYCTLGEMCDVFRRVFGEQRELMSF